MNILQLTHKKKWFDMCDEGVKLEEYREIKPYWVNRFLIDKSPHWSIWEEPGCYEEMIYNMRNNLRGFTSVQELLNHYEVKFKHFDAVQFRNGYAKTSPVRTFEFKGFTIGHGLEQWGGNAPTDKMTFILKLGNKIK